ncbi:MAG: response regulator, partial [Bacteroidota bacterium]
MMKVVLVEDEQPAAQSLRALLKDIDETIEVLAILYTLEEALYWLQHHTAHLIFMDVNLGNRTAFELFEHIDLQTPI